MTAGRVFWGLLILGVGVILLLANYGLVPTSFWSQLWYFWPILLVIWGLSVIFTTKKGGGWIFLIFAILLIALAGIFAWNNSDKETPSKNEVSVLENIDDSIKESEVNIKYGAAELFIEEGSDTLIEGNIDSLGEPQISRMDIGDKARVDINQVVRGSFIWGGKNLKSTLRFKLNKKIPYNLNIDTGASKFDLDLENVNLSKLEINSGATDGTVKIGKLNNDVKISIDSGASSFKVKLPKDFGIKINFDAGVSSNNFSDLGLKKDGKIWTNDLYETSENKIELDLNLGVSSVNLELY